MKTKLFVFLISTLSLGAFASPRMVTKEELGMFKNSTTCVVLDNGGILYNTLLKDAIEKSWKITPFEFISQKDFESRRTDSRYSFLVLMKGVHDKDPGGVSYDYLSLVLGGPERIVTDMPEICSIPVSYSLVNSDNYGYVLSPAIKFMQRHAKTLDTKRVFIKLNGLKYYNGTQRITDKVLLLDKSMMASSANTEGRIRNVYPYYFKLLNTKEFQEELSLNPKNTMFVFHVGPNKQPGSGKCFEMIFDMEGNLYYYNARNITNDNEDGFNLNDFKQLR